eukprot:gb/GEZN01002682.1/.p1 GENE.gb/GEZN01002682.1/~~gb/GEZN01002682.1/.p1  ORF type:complete len:738 (-),score=61.21 gb/GEZN01002682.1/:170-2383(-)
MAKIAVNTTLSGAFAGAIVCVLDQTHMRAVSTSNGVLAGVVGITAGCATVEPWGACCIGLISSFAFLGGNYFVDNVLHIDDPVSAGAIHLFGGAWGLLAVGIFSSRQGIKFAYGFDNDAMRSGLQLGVQCLGLICIVVWSAVTSFVVYFVLGKFVKLRVDLHKERKGIDYADHGVKPITDIFMERDDMPPSHPPPYRSTQDTRPQSEIIEASLTNDACMPDEKNGTPGPKATDLRDGSIEWQEVVRSNDEEDAGDEDEEDGLVFHPVATVISQEQIYVLGGREKATGPECVSSHVYLAAAERYDAKTGNSTQLTRMTYPRYGCVAAVMNRHIYVIGGMDETGLLASVERYDISSDSWQTLPALKHARIGCTAHVFDGQIYVFGGFDGMSHLTSVERFDPATNEWSSMAALAVARSSCAAATLGKKIYVIGGAATRDPKPEEPIRALAYWLTSVERYDPQTNVWTKLCPLSLPRRFPTTTVIDGQLHVVGHTTIQHSNEKPFMERGGNLTTQTEQKTLQTPPSPWVSGPIERYHVIEDRWEVVVKRASTEKNSDNKKVNEQAMNNWFKRLSSSSGISTANVPSLSTIEFDSSPRSEAGLISAAPPLALASAASSGLTSPRVDQQLTPSLSSRADLHISIGTKDAPSVIWRNVYLSPSVSPSSLSPTRILSVESENVPDSRNLSHDRTFSSDPVSLPGTPERHVAVRRLGRSQTSKRSGRTRSSSPIRETNFVSLMQAT